VTVLPNTATPGLVRAGGKVTAAVDRQRVIALASCAGGKVTVTLQCLASTNLNLMRAAKKHVAVRGGA
jgi:hypothetical protein